MKHVSGDRWCLYLQPYPMTFIMRYGSKVLVGCWKTAFKVVDWHFYLSKGLLCVLSEQTPAD